MAYLRMWGSFQLFYDSVVQEASDKTDKPKLPQPKRIPKQIDDGVDDYQHITPRDYYRQTILWGIRYITWNTAAINQTSLSILSEMEDILISASNGTLKQPSENIMKVYSSVINFDKPVNQLSMLQDFVHKVQQAKGQKKISKVSTICKVMNSSDLEK